MIQMDENMVKKMMDLSPLGLLIYDVNTGNCLYANNSAADMTGGTIEQLLSQNFRSIEAWKISGLLEHAEDAIKNNEILRKKVRHISTFGKEFWADCVFIPFLDKNYLFVVLDNITALTEKIDELEKLTKALVGRETKMAEMKKEIKDLQDKEQ